MLASLFQLGVTSFYDDFAVTEEDAILTETVDLVNEFFELLGWDVKELPSFSEQPEPLGAKFDFRRAAFGEIRVGNRPSRVDEMSPSVTCWRSASSTERSWSVSVAGSSTPVACEVCRLCTASAQPHVFGPGIWYFYEQMDSRTSCGRHWRY